MYFRGLSKGKEPLQNDTGLNSERERVESYLETSKRNPVSMVTLFGRQVFPMQRESSQSVGEQPRSYPKRDIDLRLPPADPCVYNFHRSIEHDNLGGSRDTSVVGISTGIESVAKEESTAYWLSERNRVIVINLEESPSRVSQKEVEPSASVSCIRRNLESQPSVLSSQNISNILKADQSLVDDDRCCGNQRFSDEGYRSGNTTKTMTNMSSSKQSFVSSCVAPRLLDLNETPVDEPCPDRHGYLLQDLNYPYTDETTLSGEKSGIEDPSTPFGSPRRESVLDKDSTASPASYTSCCTTENNSTISPRCSSPRAPVPSCRARLEYPETEALPVEPTNECCTEEDCSESSLFIKMAAESLVHISHNGSYRNEELPPSKPEPRSNSSGQDLGLSSKPEPECSYDSYELLTLEIAETGHEDYCVSSKAVDEVNIAAGENREVGIKVRRGRRMKNFQREILPGLASLSRHEIREDINILEAVLRSREYKKMMHGKTGGDDEDEDDKCGTNPRKRRSGLRYVGRRRRRSE